MGHLLRGENNIDGILLVSPNSLRTADTFDSLTECSI